MFKQEYWHLSSMAIFFFQIRINGAYVLESFTVTSTEVKEYFEEKNKMCVTVVPTGPRQGSGSHHTLVIGSIECSST